MTIFQTAIFLKEGFLEMPKKDYTVLESEEELLDMIKNEKRGRFRDRLRLLWLLKSRKAETMQHAAEFCSVSRHTAGRWFRRYETFGITELMRLKTVPGRSRAVPAEVAECLKKRLSEPEGFGSYDEIRIWIKENYNLDIPYKTVHKTVKYYLEAGPKTPRPSHIKKTKRKCGNSKSHFPINCLK